MTGQGEREHHTAAETACPGEGVVLSTRTRAGRAGGRAWDHVARGTAIHSRAGTLQKQPLCPQPRCPWLLDLMGAGCKQGRRESKRPCGQAVVPSLFLPSRYLSSLSSWSSHQRPSSLATHEGEAALRPACVRAGPSPARLSRETPEGSQSLEATGLRQLGARTLQAPPPRLWALTAAVFSAGDTGCGRGLCAPGGRGTGEWLS